MKELLMVLLISCSVFFVACGSKSSSETDKKNEMIDISKISSDMRVENFGKAEMNVYNPSNEELSEEADVIFRGKIVNMKAEVDSSVISIDTDYTFEVEEFYKGEADKELTLSMSGGILKYEDYVAQLPKDEKVSDEIYQKNKGKYYVFMLDGFEPLIPEKEYVIYAKYNKEKKIYSLVDFYYGIYGAEDNGTDYTRHGIDETDKQTITLTEIKDNAKK